MFIGLISRSNKSHLRPAAEGGWIGIQTWLTPKCSDQVLADQTTQNAFFALLGCVSALAAHIEFQADALPAKFTEAGLAVHDSRFAI
jgi:hypothetical protein